MRNRLLVIATALALAFVACGDTTATTASSPPSTDGATTTTGVPVEGITAAYGFPVGESLVYDSAVATDMEMEFLSDGGGLEGLDGPLTMGLDVSASSTYTFSDGPEPGTTEVAVIQELAEFAVRQFEMGGEDLASIMQGQLQQQFEGPDGLAGFLPEFQVVVDERGEVVDAATSGGASPLDLLGNPLSAGGFGDLSNPVRGFLGPELPDGPLQVGTAWTAEDSVEVPFLGAELSTSTDYEIVAIEGTADAPILVIEATAVSGGFAFDLQEMLANLSESPEALELAGLDESDLSELSAAADLGMEMSFTIDETTTFTTTRFDVARGLMTHTDTEGAMNLSILMTIPEQGTVAMKIDGTVVTTLRLRG